MGTPARKYSCGNAAETLQWMNAIADFLRPFRPLLDSHVVNFFKDRLWELVDEEWMECLRKEPVENLLNIPSGFVQDYWPSSLQDFILTLRSLSFPREQKFPDSELFAGGSAASSVTIELVMSELMRNPKSMKKAQMEIREAVQGKTKLEESDISKLKFLKLVIMETLRLHPPSPLLIRVCRESCQVQGYEIPKGMRVLVNVWALARDDKCWEDADCFKPERFQGSSIGFKGTDSCFLPFGAGGRMCPGITFGMANVEIALANLLFYFDWKLPLGMKANELDMTETFSGIVTRKHKLSLLATAHIPLTRE